MKVRQLIEALVHEDMDAPVRGKDGREIKSMHGVLDDDFMEFEEIMALSLVT